MIHRKKRTIVDAYQWDGTDERYDIIKKWIGDKSPGFIYRRLEDPKFPVLTIIDPSIGGDGPPYLNFWHCVDGSGRQGSNLTVYPKEYIYLKNNNSYVSVGSREFEEEFELIEGDVL